MSLEKIAQQIVELGLLSESSLREFLPKGENRLVAEDFLRELVKRKKITAFQAKQLAIGRGSELWFGSYLLLDKIGSGGMGQVYRAEHRRMKRTVALKTLPAAKARDRDVIARFEREVEAAAKLSHPNIVTAHDAGENNGKLFLVMEYIRGSDLSTIVTKDGPLSPGKTSDLILQAARGLEFAHQHGIVHRDIKPSNLLLDEKGVVKILDMGLARIEQSEEMTRRYELTDPAAVMGTVDYMAPEQWSDSHTADGRADLYALGCTLFFLLAGRAPYADDDHRTAVRKMVAHVSEPIPDLRAVRSDTPERLLFIYQKLMAKKSGDRFQSATELIAVLTGKAKPEPDISSASRVFLEGLAEASQISAGKAPAACASGAQPIDTKALSSGTMEAAINSARKFYESHDYPVVIGLIEGVAIANRTPELESLLEQAKERHRKCEKLLAEIEEAKLHTDPRKLKQKAEQLLKLKPGHTPTRRLLTALESYGGRLDAVVFDGAGDVRACEQPSSLFKGLGAYYLAVWCTALIAFGFGSLMIYSYLGQSKQPGNQRLIPPAKDSVDADAAKPAVEPISESPRPAAAETADTPKHAEAATDSPPLFFTTPAFADWVAGIAKLSVEEQVRAVKEKLMELNPHFKGKVTHESVYGVVEKLGFNTDHITDISPVRAFSKLKELTCAGNYPNKGTLRDISPLTGMKLTLLDCQHNPIADLSPVKGMPLRMLRINNTKIKELEPIRGMKINDLGIWRTTISDISPLSGMPLHTLICSYSNVQDLTPIADTKLKHLECEWTRVSDLTPLKKMTSLRSLKIYRAPVKSADIDSLKELLPDCKFITKEPAAKK